MKKYQIYGLYCPFTNELKYVGATSVGLLKRLQFHIKNARNIEKYKSIKDNWLRSIAPIVPIIKEIEACNSDNWQERERFWISNFKSIGIELLNITIGGYGLTGYKHTEERKKEISIFFKGHTYSRGRKRTTYVWNNGVLYKPTSEVLEKRLEKRKQTLKKGGFKSQPRSKGKTTDVLQLSTNGDFIAEYKTTMIASFETGIKRTTITENLRGANKSAGGFIWKFKYPKD